MATSIDVHIDFDYNDRANYPFLAYSERYGFIIVGWYEARILRTNKVGWHYNSEAERSAFIPITESAILKITQET